MKARYGNRRAATNSGGVIAFILGVLLVVALALLLPRTYLTGDAPRLQGVGTVVEAEYRPPSRANPSKPPWFVRVRLGDKVHTANSLVPAEAGQSVRVFYRRGRSGRVWIDKIEPIAKLPDQPAK